MTSRSKAVRSAQKPDKKIALKAKKSAGNAAKQRLASTGPIKRTQAHESSRGKRAQAKRDSR